VGIGLRRVGEREAGTKGLWILFYPNGKNESKGIEGIRYAREIRLP